MDSTEFLLCGSIDMSFWKRQIILLHVVRLVFILSPAVTDAKAVLLLPLKERGQELV